MKIFKIISFLIALTYTSNIISFAPNVPQFILVVLLLFSLLLSIKSGFVGVNELIIWIVIVCVFSILFNDIPSFFLAPQRFLFFLLSILIFSPLLHGGNLALIKLNTFRYTNVFIISITLLSFLGKITGFYVGYDWAGGFSGLTILSMILSPCAAISLLICIYQFYLKKNKYIYLCLALISFFTLLIAGSRIALLGAILGFFVFFIKIYKKNLTYFWKKILLVLVIVLLTSPIWISFTATLLHKIEYSKENGSSFATREDLWQYRYDEFIESPIYGIGFSNSKKGNINYETGSIEPGTSWGVVFAMLGVLGGFALIILVFNYCKFLYNDSNNILLNSLLLSLLVFFLIHWIAEGYILSAGSFLFFYSWLLLGVIQEKKNNKNIILI